MKKIAFLFTVLLLNCSEAVNEIQEISTEDSISFLETFDSQTQFELLWEDASQNNSPENYVLNNGELTITTRANVVDRVKVKTKRADFGLGTYTWRIYVSEREIGDRNSIGAFLYLNDNRELDFEIGSGNTETRNLLNANTDDLLVYCTSQDAPFVSNPYLIKHNKWYDFKIELTLDATTSNYIINWFVDNNLLQTQLLEYGNENLFAAYCSLENLHFIGDQLPSQEYNTFFDSFKFEEN